MSPRWPGLRWAWCVAAATLASLPLAVAQGDAYLAPLAPSRIYGSSAAHRNLAWEEAQQRAQENRRAAPFRVLITGDTLAYGCGDLAFYPAFDQCDCSPSNSGFRVQVIEQLQAYWEAVLPEAVVEVQAVGTLSSPHEVSEEKARHEARLGHRIDELADVLRPLWQELSPHFVLIISGAHDAMQYASTAKMLKRLGILLDDVMAFNPTTRVFLGSLPDPGNVTDAQLHNIRKFNTLLPAFVEERRGLGQEAFFVDIAGALPLYCSQTNATKLTVADTPDCCLGSMGLTKAGYSRVSDLFVASISSSFDSEGTCAHGEVCRYNEYIAWRLQMEAGLRSYRSFQSS